MPDRAIWRSAVSGRAREALYSLSASELLPAVSGSRPPGDEVLLSRA